MTPDDQHVAAEIAAFSLQHDPRCQRVDMPLQDGPDGWVITQHADGSVTVKDKGAARLRDLVDALLAADVDCNDAEGEDEFLETAAAFRAAINALRAAREGR